MYWAVILCSRNYTKCLTHIFLFNPSNDPTLYFGSKWPRYLDYSPQGEITMLICYNKHLLRAYNESISIILFTLPNVCNSNCFRALFYRCTSLNSWWNMRKQKCLYLNRFISDCVKSVYVYKTHVYLDFCSTDFIIWKKNKNMTALLIIYILHLVPPATEKDYKKRLSMKLMWAKLLLQSGACILRQNTVLL